MISALWSRKTGPLFERLVGSDRLVGLQAYQQMVERYRALRRSRQLLSTLAQIGGKAA